MKKIALFTIIDREAIFLPLWISYYKKNISNINIFVLTRNNNIFNFNKLNNDDICVINIDDEINDPHSYLVGSHIFIKYQQYFLKHFDVVMYADIDEFIVHENLNGILQNDFISPIVTKGINVVHNLKDEPPLNLNEKFSTQRDYIVYSEWYDKPLILNSPISWTDGKHNFSTYNNYVDGLYLIDIGKICFYLWRDLAIETMNMYSTYQKDISIESYSEIFSNMSRPDHTMIKMDDNIKKIFSLICN